jgi:hypothetical protein
MCLASCPRLVYKTARGNVGVDVVVIQVAPRGWEVASLGSFDHRGRDWWGRQGLALGTRPQPTPRADITTDGNIYHPQLPI